VRIFITTPLPLGDKHWVDGLDKVTAQPIGDQPGRGAANVVEMIEKLEPTIGLEPMTCRL
jgi:hypothetical protein